MSTRFSRATLGNVVVLVLLAVIGGALLRLHLGEAWWQGAPPSRQWGIALAATALYSLACAVVWWRSRPRDDTTEGDSQPMLLVWSSQTGFARELAKRSAQALRSAGVPVRLRGLHDVDAHLLADSARALFIVSTTGEGDAPDHALPFLRRVMTTPPPLGHLQYGVLALGDRSYGHFCAFGHQLHDWLRQHEGSEKQVRETIFRCKNAGLNVKINMNVNRRNRDVVFDSVKMLADLGVDSIRLIKTTEAPRWQLNAG
ncbi:MAG: flavodoxin domain-containing protein, partial [Stenotrophomonas maltophilia]